MLAEILFGTVFFLLPIVGMISMVVVKGLLNEAQQEVDMEQKRGAERWRRVRSTSGSPSFIYDQVRRYQLIEGRVHEPCFLRNQKGRRHQRAGP